MILLLIVAGAVYAVCGGIESRARVYEVLFWFILVPYVGMMLVSVRDIKIEYLAPILSIDGANLWKGSYLVFLLLTPLFFLLFLVCEKEMNYGRNIVKTILVSLLCSSGILLVSYVLLIGNFGANSLANLRFPVVTLMSTIQFEGNFLKRMDALMLAVWFFTLYALLNLHLHYGIRMFAEFGKDSQNLKWWQLALPGMAVFFIGFGMHKNSGCLQLFLNYYSHIAIMFMLVAPLVLLAFRKRGREK